MHYSIPRLGGTLFSVPRRFVALLACAAVAMGLFASDATAQSQVLPLGSSMPAAGQTLQNATGQAASLQSLAGSKGTAVIFWSNQCPWVDKYEKRMMSLVQKYQGQGIQFVLINANSASAFPKESLSASKQRAEGRGYSVPYLRDNGAAVAEAFGAARTPHVFVFDGSNTLVYVGTVDDSPGDPSNVQKPYLDNALQAVVSGSNVPVAQTKAFGCTIKK